MKKRPQIGSGPGVSSSGSEIVDVFYRLMDSAGVAASDRNEVLRTLLIAYRDSPGETPAKVFNKVRRSDGLIPTARCDHGVRRGDCVVCDAGIGTRFYLTGGGTHLHSRPTCEALAAGQEKVRRRGGNPEPIEVVRLVGEQLMGRDPCGTCMPKRPSTLSAVRNAPGAVLVTPPPENSTPTHAPERPRMVQLSVEAPPTIGQNLTWGGHSGRVVAVETDGVRIAVGGLTIFVPVGERVSLSLRQSN